MANTEKFLNSSGLSALWAKIKAIIPQQEDDIDVLNLLSEFGYSTSNSNVVGTGQVDFMTLKS